MKRALLPRLLALAVVILLGGYYIVVNVLHVSIGNAPFDVTLQLPRAGGIYTSADVTYRGVGVGTVTRIQVQPQGVAVTLRLDHGTRIPTDVAANVRQLSAIGEQYVDLVPASSSGPVLRAGSVIPADRATVPVPIGTALNSLGALLDSLNEQDLTTVQKFLTTGFSGTGPDLRTLITSSQQLTQALAAAQPQTAALIQDGTPVLTTLNDTNPQFAQYTRSLNELTAQFAASDADLRALIAKGGPATGQLADLLAKTRTDIAGTIAGLGSGSAAVLQYQPQVAELFAMLPVVALDLRDVTAGGTVHGSIALNGGSTVCTYLVPSAVPLPDQRTTAVDLDNGCARTAGDLLQRGAATAPGPSR